MTTIEEGKDMILLEVTWGRTLKICWSILWRSSVFGFLAAAGIGLVLRVVLRYAGANSDITRPLSNLAGAVASFAVIPPVLKAVLKKPFSDFRIALVRER